MYKLLSSLLDRLRARATGEPPATEPSRNGWTASDWARVRAPERHRDRELSAKAQRWLERLPADARPHDLARQYPRIANRIAALWRDPGLTEQVLGELLNDTRGGRQGFPATVRAELELLAELHDARAETIETADDRWPAAASR